MYVIKQRDNELKRLVISLFYYLKITLVFFLLFKVAITILRYAIAADINNDGSINASDLNLFKRMMAGSYMPEE